MSSTPLICPSCDKPVADGQFYCANCGASLELPTWAPRSSVAPSESWDTVLVADTVRAVPRALSRTKTGLLLMIFGFALDWVPYISDLGGLLILIGVGYLWFGRHGFTDSRRRAVVWGSAAVALSLLLGFGIVIWFLGDVTSAASGPGETTAALTARFQYDIQVPLAGVVGASALGASGYVLLPYALADRTSRIMLWTAFALTIWISVLSLAIISPQISTAVAQALSATPINLAPVQALQSEEAELGALQFLPFMLFLWAYYRTRVEVFSEHPPETKQPAEPGKFARTD
jgi:hypothetical protein